MVFICNILEQMMTNADDDGFLALTKPLCPPRRLC